MTQRSITENMKGRNDRVYGEMKGTPWNLQTWKWREKKRNEKKKDQMENIKGKKEKVLIINKIKG